MGHPVYLVSSGTAATIRIEEINRIGFGVVLGMRQQTFFGLYHLRAQTGR